MTYSFIVLGIPASLLLSYLCRKLFVVTPRLPLPPGPKPWPIVGNITDLPPPGDDEAGFWAKHKEEYGAFTSITVFGQTMVIIHDPTVAHELLEQRSAKTAARPSMVFASDLCGYEDFLVMQSYNNIARNYRKLINLQLGTKAAMSRFSALQEVETERLLLRILNTPQDLIKHLKTEAGAIILKLTYGYTVETEKPDPLVDLAATMMDNFSAALLPGAWLVDIVPALKYLPSWLPGMSFKRTAKEYNQNLQRLASIPYDFVKSQMGTKTNQRSYVSSLLEDCADGEIRASVENDHAIKWSAASMYSAGSDTTAATLSFFFLAMVKFPEVQRKAQAEMDRVVGTSRLPRLEDLENLPYIRAIALEALRWQPATLFGIPHTADEELEYAGYRIPKGAILLPNMSWFLNDPNTYHDATSFKPERYFEPFNEPSPQKWAFGFGRRVCPGRILAESSLSLTIAKSLAVFDIGKKIDGDAHEIEPVWRVVPGTILHPAPYDYNITPRSEQHALLIRKVQVDHPWEESDAKYLGAVALDH